MAVALVALLCAGSSLRAYPMLGQEQPDQLKFNYDGPMLLIYTIKPERAADFEAVWAGIRAGLAKSQDVDLKAFSETLQLYKVKIDQPAPPPPPAASGGQPAPPPPPVIYVFRLDPPSKAFTYNPVKLMYDNVDTVGPDGAKVVKGFTRAEADELYKKFEGAYTGIQPLPLVKVGG
jgi:hypothetical protein